MIAARGGSAAASLDLPGGRSPWLVTFVDLTALLIAFMVMLFSMSELDLDRWRMLRDSLVERDSATAEISLVRSREIQGLEAVETFPGIDLDYLAGVLRRDLRAGGPLGAAVVLRRGDRLVVSLPARLLFAPGATGLEPGGRAATATLAAILSNIDNRIEVVGHADPTPPQAGFASNWELSLTRALAVADGMARAGFGRAVVVRGLGESRYAGLAGALPAGLAEGDRRALARRVDVVIHDDVGERDR